MTPRVLLETKRKQLDAGEESGLVANFFFQTLFLTVVFISNLFQTVSLMKFKTSEYVQSSKRI